MSEIQSANHFWCVPKPWTSTSPSPAETYRHLRWGRLQVVRAQKWDWLPWWDIPILGGYKTDQITEAISPISFGLTLVWPVASGSGTPRTSSTNRLETAPSEHGKLVWSVIRIDHYQDRISNLSLAHYWHFVWHVWILCSLTQHWQTLARQNMPREHFDVLDGEVGDLLSTSKSQHRLHMGINNN